MKVFQVCGGYNPSASNTVYKFVIYVDKELTFKTAVDAMVELRSDYIKGKENEEFSVVAGNAKKGKASPISSGVPVSNAVPLSMMSEKQMKMNLRNLFKNLEQKDGSQVAEFIIRVERFGYFLRSKNLESYAMGEALRNENKEYFEGNPGSLWGYHSTKEPDAPLPIIWEILKDLFPRYISVDEIHEWYMQDEAFDEGFLGSENLSDYLDKSDMV
jgi:hypothetical protein